jgi:hypothetical protein
MRKIFSLPIPILASLFTVLGLVAFSPLFAHLNRRRAEPPPVAPAESSPAVVDYGAEMRLKQELAAIKRRDADSARKAILDRLSRREGTQDGATTGSLRVASNEATPPPPSTPDPLPEQAPATQESTAPQASAAPESPNVMESTPDDQGENTEDRRPAPRRRKRYIQAPDPFGSMSASAKLPFVGPALPYVGPALPYVGPALPYVGAGICGAPTRDGTPCQRRVAGGGYCWQHR